MAKIDENLVLIDADSIIYLLGPSLESMPLEPLGLIKLDEFLKDILISTRSQNYMGFFGGKGINFRKAIAVTTKYKGSRAEADEKPEWFKFWEPIFKNHMETVWGFQPCNQIEADDAVAIAAEKYRGQYKKITIASPDKDLYQIPEIWIYNYDKRFTVWVDKETALTKYLVQLIKGDGGDDIPGLFGAGPKVAQTEVDRINKLGYNKAKSIEEIKKYYVKWHTEIQLEKQTRKQQKAYLDQYKKDNDIKRFTAKTKDEALQKFVVDTSMLLSATDAKKLFLEQKALLTMLTTEKEGKKYKFNLGGVLKDTRVDWDSIVTYDDDLANISEEEDIDFMDDEL